MHKSLKVATALPLSGTMCLGRKPEDQHRGPKTNQAPNATWSFVRETKSSGGDESSPVSLSSFLFRVKVTLYYSSEKSKSNIILFKRNELTCRN